MFLRLFLLHQLLLPFSIDAQLKDHGDRLILKSSTPCEGHLEVYHNGLWSYVGDNRWQSSTEKVVCHSTHCGTPVSVQQVLMPPNSQRTVWLNEMNCNGSEDHLWECPNPGWGVSKFNKDTMRWIKCSDEIKIHFDKLQYFQCEGVVKYFISPRNQSGYFCDDNFGMNEANILCKDLGCDEALEVYQMDWPEGDNFGKMTINCSDHDHLNHLWQCASSVKPGQPCLKRAAVTCTGQKRVQLVGNSDNVCRGKLQIRNITDTWSPVMNEDTIRADSACKQMHCGTNAGSSLESDGMQLNCTNTVTVALSEKCFGSVYISVNNTNHSVCGSHWTKENSEVVCNELNCGKALISQNTSSVRSHGIMDNVECSGNESSLWHCSAKGKNNANPLSCTTLVNLMCAESLSVKLVDGPGRCAGRLEIQRGEESFRVADSEWIKSSLGRICHILGCGNDIKDVKETFSPGSGDFFKWAVNCGAEAKDISDCIDPGTITSSGTSKPLMLACEEYTTVSLSGKKSCAGHVRIRNGDQIYWLSGSNSTWNSASANAVCRQLHCGRASKHSSINPKKDIWKKSYNCTSNATSLFNCDIATLASDHSNSTAHVTCEGSINVDLTEDCWGHVNVCVGERGREKCGGVRNDTWTEEKSKTLCQNLGCGTAITSTESPNGKMEVIVESLHTYLSTDNLNGSIVVLSQIQPKSLTIQPNSAYVVCSGSLKSKISDPRYKCSGNMQVEVEGQWLPVCKDAIKDTETKNTICSHMKCGLAIDLLDHFGPPPASPLVISKLQWPSSSNDVSNVAKSNQGCPLAGIHCSDWKKMEVKFNRSCSGDVFLYSEGQRRPVSADGWKNEEGHRLCSDLQCDNLVSVNRRKSTVALWNSNIRCRGVNNTENIWDCENKMVTTAKEQKEQLVIECEGEPTVTLEKRCHGLVKINNMSVCSDGKTLEHAHIACMEQDCGNAVLVDDVSANRNPDGLLIRCESYHDRLGKCSRVPGKCKKGLMSIHCAESIKLKTKDHCRGPIQMVSDNRREWKDVCIKDLPTGSEGEFCRQLGCDGGNHSRKYEMDNKQSSEVTAQVMLTCTTDHKDMRYCVSRGTCGERKALAIQCIEYVVPPPKPRPEWIVLYALIPVVVLLLALFLRVFLIRRSKERREDAAVRPLPRTEDDFDSDNRFTSEVESRAKRDAHSSSSFPYDDVEEAKPLASSGATDDAPDSATEDAVTYEVDDPQYGYDDVGEPTPAVTQAEVHRAAGCAPKELTEDYLVPGQDN